MIRNITILIALTLLSNNVMADGDSCLFECAIGKLAYIHSGPMSASTACGKPELKNSLMKYSADGIFTGAYRNINDSSPTKICFTPKNGIKVVVLSKPNASGVGPAFTIAVSPVSDMNISFDMDIYNLEKTK